MRFREVNAEVAAAIRANDGYCCCAIEKNKDTKCPCKAFREQPEPGLCECGRFVKEDF